MRSRTPAWTLSPLVAALSVAGAIVAIGIPTIAPEHIAIRVPVLAAAADSTPAGLVADERPADPLLALAQRDPAALIARGEQRLRETIRDYSCTFLKQELLPDGLTPVQEIRVLYREAPRSCFMTWQRNVGEAKRVLWIEKPEFVDDDGRPVAKVEPGGAVLRLVLSEIMLPIHGAQAKKTSRRSIDEFGFRAMFELLARTNARARERGILDFRFDGEGEVDGRPTLIFRRLLPESLVGEFPDARMVMHLDREWLLPVAIYSHADHAGNKLLGSYVLTQVKLNPGLDDDAFRF
ncbi:MAG: DUF1571 domain-containing protein [Phycisphaerales bacterium]|nr:DUF1571 domain-containing protein [Phycisphaerales bacterium]